MGEQSKSDPIIVLGAGIVGVAQAYCLARQGRKVTVIERCAGPARETSFANAGIVAPAHASAWASPHALATLIQSLWKPDSSVRFRFHRDPAFWRFCMAFLRNCTKSAYLRNTEMKLILALYSAGELKRIAEDCSIHYDQQYGGALYVHRDRARWKEAGETFGALKRHGLTIEVADPERCVEIEPALTGARDRIAGGIFSPGDYSGDCRLFSERLAAYSRDELGVDFRFETTVTGLSTSGGKVRTVEIRNAKGEKERLDAGGFVVCLGVEAPFVLRPIGVDVPVYPVKGYSLTFPVGESARPPSLTGLDEHNLIAFTRMGNRLRLTATAEFAGYDASHEPADFEHMTRVARDLFPDGADYDSPSYWACLRPMTPQGPPILGRAPGYDNLWLSLGHGHMGWTMAAGTARILADTMAGREPAIRDAWLHP